MNKKIISLIIAGTIAASMTAAFAENNEVVNTSSQTTAEQTVEKTVINYIGTVKAVDKNIVTVAVEAENEVVEAAYAVTEKTPVYDVKGNKVDELKEGDKVTVMTDASLLTKDIKPVKAIILNNDENGVGTAYYDTFSKSEFGFISSDGELVLNIDDKLEEEYEGKTLLVFYDFMTLSLPAQTNPTKIVVVDNEEEELAEETKVQTVNQYSGVVEAYEKNILTVSVDGESVAFACDESTPVYDMKSQKESEIKEGDLIYVFSSASLLTKDIKPVKAVVTGVSEDEAVSVKLDKFTDSEWGLVSSDNELVINVEDKSGYEGKELLVFYDITTRSIPAQTNPLAVIVIEDNCKVSISFKVGDSVLSINGEDVEVEKPYVVGEGTTLVPVRVISEAFGADVDWEGETKTVTITNNNKKIELQIDSTTAKVENIERSSAAGNTIKLEAAAELTENGYTMVPLRFISETFGAEVSYDEATEGITVELN